MSEPTGLDRVRAAVERSRGGQLPRLPVTLCGNAGYSAPPLNTGDLVNDPIIDPPWDEDGYNDHLERKPVPIPLPPEPPHDRVIEALDSGHVVERFTWNDGAWWDEDDNPWLWQRDILSTGARHSWTLQHRPAEEA